MDIAKEWLPLGCAGEALERLRMTEAKKSEVLQGTLDLMVLKTLHALGPQHGFGIARRIEQVSREVLQLNEGTVYTSLLRLQPQGGDNHEPEQDVEVTGLCGQSARILRGRRKRRGVR
jgi:hypothetical protein